MSYNDVQRSKETVLQPYGQRHAPIVFAHNDKTVSGPVYLWYREM